MIAKKEKLFFLMKRERKGNDGDEKKRNYALEIDVNVLKKDHRKWR